jgi:hypothetical protein
MVEMVQGAAVPTHALLYLTFFPKSFGKLRILIGQNFSLSCSEPFLETTDEHLSLENRFVHIWQMFRPI